MSGCLTLVSLGPGDLDYLPPVARRAIEAADVVIGYRLYLDLIRPLLASHQHVVASELGLELERASQALERAAQGQRVALVSSGDVGIYAMAGPVYEVLRARGWQSGAAPDVQVIPGISALQAAAARLGAPVAHDFCAISLSDLHTDWASIARRIEAAARGDFVIAFYNPRSHGRDWQLAEARRILLLNRSPETPVGLVRKVTRPDESIRLATLRTLDETLVDMFTLVVVGNSHTARLGACLATPRGYTHAVTQAQHEAKELLPSEPSYPINLVALRGAPVSMVGGGAVAERKTKGVLGTGARVRLISPQATPWLQAQSDVGALEWVARPYRAGDVAGAHLVFVATSDHELNAAVARECHAAGIWVNVADSPALCTFTLPAIARRDGLIMAVNTVAHHPARAVRVRDHLLKLDHLP